MEPFCNSSKRIEEEEEEDEEKQERQPFKNGARSGWCAKVWERHCVAKEKDANADFGGYL